MSTALLQRDSGTVYLAYRKGSNIYAISNSGSGWSSPVQTTAVAQGNPALLDLITDIVLIYKGTDAGQTSFTFDLTGLTIADGILLISSTAVPTPETLYETNSEPGIGWQNTGTWEGKYFKADYFRCAGGPPDPDCYDGETKIGPFEHYPGSPNYTGYTTWIEDNLQYVKTSYSTVINEYPAQVDYRINTTSWNTITDNLGSGTTSIIIPASNFLHGLNTLQFEESNTYSTEFEWTLYIDQGAVSQEYTTNFTYDSYGNITSITNPLGNTTTFVYDSHSIYLSSVTDELNNTITATFNFSTGLLTSFTDAKGYTSSFEYDLLGRVTKKINPDLTEKEAVYDDLNNYVTIYDELDHKKIMYYDGICRLTKVEKYLSPVSYLAEIYTYNYQGSLKTRTDTGGHIYTYEYDSLGRVTKIFNPDSTFKQTLYNDITNTATVLNENQQKTEYQYDWAGNLLRVKEYTDPVNYFLTQYTYDSLGNVTSLTDANGYTAFYEYDSLYGITRTTHPDLTTEEFSYDAVGNVVETTSPMGTTTFTYDALNQLTSIQYPDQSVTTYEYDVNGNRTLMVDPAGTTSHTYDNRDRLISDTRVNGGESYTINYAYDAASRLVSVTYPDQSVVTYEYDSLNRLITIPGYANFTYNDSHLATVTFNNGAVTTLQYDIRDRPTRIHTLQNGTDLLLMDYVYDPVGNVTQLDYKRRLPDYTWAESTETFAYDWLNRLVSAQGDYGSLSYSYDPVGNRLSQNSVTYTYDTMNELLSVSDGTLFTYDEYGNTLTKTDGTTTWSYSYDRRNLLQQVVKNQQMVGEYVYDGDGKRIQVTEDGETTTYIYSGAEALYEENTIGTAVYLYGPTGRLAKRRAINGENHTFYYHTDNLHSTRLVTEEDNVVASVEYEPFGESTTEGEENYLFTNLTSSTSATILIGSLDPKLVIVVHNASPIVYRFYTLL